MSTHIAAETGQIAPRVLLPGDPLRATWIAENFLTDATRYSEVRGMYGYTGTYAGERVSVQGTGMGMPSASIYINELIQFYDAQQLIRVGSCGALTTDLKIRDVVIGQAAASDSAMNQWRFGGFHYPATANFALLEAAARHARERGAQFRVGTLFSSDSFYHPRPELTDNLVQYGIVAVEMEAAELYTLAARYGRAALAICTVSDHIVTGEATSAMERQESFGDMVQLALDTALAVPLPQ